VTVGTAALAGSGVLSLDLWNPHSGLALWAVLVTAVLLGMVHGVTPDEHTWPITFSYAVAGYSARAGMRAALTFSAAFTLQRALASELAYLALARYLVFGSTGDYVVYVVVGVAMFWAALYITRRRVPWHLDVHLHGRRHAHPHVHVHAHGGVPLASDGSLPPEPCPECDDPGLSDPRWWMPALHGFIAGWGVGAFAVIVYTVLAPSMPSAWWGWVPGALFGLGTTLVQVAVGTMVGALMRRRGATPAQVRRIGLVVAARTLGIGGMAFVLGGAFGLAFPGVASRSISTGIHVHNLAHLGLPIVLVVVVVGGVGIGTLWSQLRQLRAAVPGLPAGGPPEPAATPGGSTGAGERRAS
jgi:ABC-type nickel/cobalt efflux system permease component RcnA